MTTGTRNTSPLFFTGCTVTDAAASQPQAGGQRRQVVINGKRVKTIDVHAHCLVPEALKLVGRTSDNHQFPDLDEVGPKRIAAMDARASTSKRSASIRSGIGPKRTTRPRSAHPERALAGMCGTYPERSSRSRP